MKSNQNHHILLLVVIVLLSAGSVYAVLSPDGMRAAIANNLWSSRFIAAAPADRLSAPLNTPPVSHKHAGMLLAHQALAQGQPELALEYLAPLVATGDALATDTFAEIHFQNGDYLTALDTWKALGAYKSLEWASHELYALNELGFTALARRYACELKPDIFGCYRLNLGLLNANELRDNGFLAYALPIYKDLTVRYPAESLTYYELAQAYAMAGDTGAAVESIQKAIALKADSPTYYLRAGALYELNAQPNEAIAAYNAVLTLEANNKTALEALQRLTETP